MQINKVRIKISDSALAQKLDKQVEVKMVEDACDVEFECRLPIASFHKLVNEQKADDNTEKIVRKLSHDEIELLSRMLEMLPLVSENRFAAFQTRDNIYQIVLERTDLQWMYEYVNAQKQLAESEMYN